MKIVMSRYLYVSMCVSAFFFQTLSHYNQFFEIKVCVSSSISFENSGKTMEEFTFNEHFERKPRVFNSATLNLILNL